MGNRLSRIYTRTGDDGSTGLAGGVRVPKYSPRVQAVGDIDELNSAIGLVLAEPGADATVARTLTAIQHELFEIGGELAMPEYQTIDDAAVARLESVLDELNAELPPLRDFVLPRGTRAIASCHLARAICRRAERTLWLLDSTEPLREELPRYLNRLSDLLFVVARSMGRAESITEQQWNHDRPEQG